MLRFAIAFAAAGAAISANASSTVERPPSAHTVIDGAFAAMASAKPAATFMYAPGAALVSAPADKAAALAFAPPDRAATAFAMVSATTSPNVSADTVVRTPPAPSIVITVDKSTQRMRVTVNGVQRWNWAVSTGRRGYATPGGTYRAFRMVRDHKSREWDNAPMPHSIFFTTRGHAIHGSFATRRLGSPASAGCVRLHPDNARQLFALVQQHGVGSATVVIAGAERTPVLARTNDAPKTQGGPQTPKQRVAQRTNPPNLSQPQGHTRPLPIAPQGYDTIDRPVFARGR